MLETGVISGFYTNGQSRELGAVGVDTHSNQEGLAEVGEKVHHVYDPRLTRIDDELFVVCAADTDADCRLLTARVHGDFERFELVGFGRDEMPISSFQVCAGPLVFRVPGGIQPGRWRLVIELEESKADIPFEIEIEDR